MKITPIYREISSIGQIVADHVLDVVADRLLSVIEEMEREEAREMKEKDNGDRWDGLS